MITAKFETTRRWSLALLPLLLLACSDGIVVDRGNPDPPRQDTDDHSQPADPVLPRNVVPHPVELVPLGDERMVPKCGPGELSTLEGCVPAGDYHFIYTDWGAMHAALRLGSLSGAEPKTLLELNVGVAAAPHVQPSPRGGQLAYLDWDLGWVLRVRSLNGGVDRAVARLDSGCYWSTLRWSPDGEQLLCGGWSNALSTQVLHLIAPERGDWYDLEIEDLGLFHWSEPRFSPDGETILFAGPERSLRLYRLSDGSLVDLYRGEGTAATGSFSPSGDRIAFLESVGHRPPWSLSVIDSDGELATRLESVDGGGHQVEWSPDGRHLAYVDFEVGCGGAQLKALELGTGEHWTLDCLTAGMEAGQPLWGPDGGSLLYLAFDQQASVAVIRRVELESGETLDLEHLKVGIYAGHPRWLRPGAQSQ